MEQRLFLNTKLLFNQYAKRSCEVILFCRRNVCGPFSGKAAVWTYDTYNSHVLCICRQLKNEMVVGVFNFSDEPQTAWIDMGEMPFQDLLGKGECVLRNIILPGNGYGWYYKTWEE